MWACGYKCGYVYAMCMCVYVYTYIYQKVSCRVGTREVHVMALSISLKCIHGGPGDGAQ